MTERPTFGRSVGKRVFDGSVQLIPTFQRITSFSMRCANKAATEEAEWMRAEGGQANQHSAAVFLSNATTKKQPTPPNVAAARGPSRDSFIHLRVRFEVA